MKIFDLKEIIEKQNLVVKEVAKELFPTNKYPKLALDRVLSGKAFLDTNQVSKLSMMTGISIEKLYSGGQWKASATDDKLKFTSENYTAELNTETWITKIYHKDSLFHEAIIHNGNIALSEYLTKLTNIINKHK